MTGYKHHTPGPWRFEPIDLSKYPLDQECAGEIMAGEGASPRGIATIWRADIDTLAPIDGWEGNARLIEVAPAMYDLLVTFVALSESDAWDNSGMVVDTLHEAREIVRYVRGEEPA